MDKLKDKDKMWLSDIRKKRGVCKTNILHQMVTKKLLNWFGHVARRN